MHGFLNGEGQKSITDDAFRDNEKSLVDTDAQEIVYLKPQKLHKAKEWIVPFIGQIERLLLTNKLKR